MEFFVLNDSSSFYYEQYPFVSYDFVHAKNCTTWEMCLTKIRGVQLERVQLSSVSSGSDVRERVGSNSLDERPKKAKIL